MNICIECKEKPVFVVKRQLCQQCNSKLYYSIHRVRILAKKKKQKSENPELFAKRNLRAQRSPKGKIRQKKAQIKREYGLTLDEYDQILSLQHNKCAICPRICENREFGVDHCHKTGKVRGLLCKNCNTGIGMLSDNIDKIKSSLVYLEYWEVSVNPVKPYVTGRKKVNI